MSDAVSRNLRLTSPYLHGADVAHLQRSLNARLKARREKVIKVDSEYGRATATAVRDVLWMLGAPTTAIEQGATKTSQQIIRRPNLRPDDWKTRARQRRSKVVKQDEAVQAVVDWLKARDGWHEDASSNTAKWLDPLEADFHLHAAAWCAVLAAWPIRHLAGVAIPDGVVYTPTILEWARNGQHGMKLLSRPRVGCWVLYKFPGVSGDPVDHVGTWIGGGETAEGNTSPDPHGSQNNGGSVAIHKRGTEYVVAYVWPYPW